MGGGDIREMEIARVLHSAACNDEGYVRSQSEGGKRKSLNRVAVLAGFCADDTQASNRKSVFRSVTVILARQATFIP